MDTYHRCTQHLSLHPHRSPYWNKPHLQSPSWHFFSLSCLFLFQTLTGCADFGSLLFSPNPPPDFPPPSQIYEDFRENAVRHQMVTKTFQLVIYSFKMVKLKKKKSASSLGYWVDIKMMMTVFWHWKIIENPSPLQSASWHMELIVTQETTKKDQEGIPFKMYRYLILMDIRQPVFPWPLEIIMQRLASCRSRLPQKVSSQI